jgi:hypothetical protein
MTGPSPGPLAGHREPRPNLKSLGLINTGHGPGQPITEVGQPQCLAGRAMAARHRDEAQARDPAQDAAWSGVAAGEGLRTLVSVGVATSVTMRRVRAAGRGGGRAAGWLPNCSRRKVNLNLEEVACIWNG